MSSETLKLRIWADVYTDVEVHECCTTDLMVHR